MICSAQPYLGCVCTVKQSLQVWCVWLVSCQYLSTSFSAGLTWAHTLAMKLSALWTLLCPPPASLPRRHLKTRQRPLLKPQERDCAQRLRWSATLFFCGPSVAVLVASILSPHLQKFWPLWFYLHLIFLTFSAFSWLLSSCVWLLHRDRQSCVWALVYNNGRMLFSALTAWSNFTHTCILQNLLNIIGAWLSLSVWDVNELAVLI